MRAVNSGDRFWSRPLTALFEELETTPAGLSQPEAERRLKRHGPNTLGTPHLGGILPQLLRFFGNPLVLILLVAAAMSAAFGEVANSVIIASMILASVLLNFFQTYRSLQAANTLRHAVVMRVDVLRNGQVLSLPASCLVPGDVFLLSAGDLVPADGRILEAKDLFVDQAPLTGESLPAEKQPGELPPPAGTLDQATNTVFTGTSILSGTARAIAVRTGAATAFGRIATELSRQPPPTEFEHGISAFGFLILRVVVALVLFVCLVLVLFKHDPVEAFLFSLALAVGLTPEFLPMIITVTLSSGALRMAKKRVIVKQLQAIENLGSIDVLCSDKTGTLTEGRIVFDRAVDAEGIPQPAVLSAAVLNSRYETGIKSPLDEAILKSPHPEPEPCTKLDEIPFDFHRRRLSVVLLQAGRRIMIAKGAPESILIACESYRYRGSDLPLDEAGRTLILETFRKLSDEGLRALAIAQREVPEQRVYEPSDERALVFLGFVTFQDPPRSDAIETLKALKADGIRVVILTGDNEWVTRKICTAVGLDGAEILLGSDLDQVRREALPRLLERVSVFARLTPEHKTRILLALKEAGHVVGYLGDGINDAPALRMADVGISVDSAVDVAKEAAPIILLDKSLQVLHEGVLEGRRSFANVLKYLMMGTSSNFGNMFSMAGAAVILPFLPMLPTQILLNNLLYDASQLTIPGDHVENEAVAHPRRWNIRFIQQFMFYLGPISSIFDFLTFGLLLGVFHASAPLFRTGWFIESLLTQTLVIFVIRTRARPWRSLPSRGLISSVLGACAVAIALPFTPLGRYLGLVVPPLSLLGALLLMTLVYLIMAEGMKRLFYARIDRSGLAGPRTGKAMPTALGGGHVGTAWKGRP